MIYVLPVLGDINFYVTFTRKGIANRYRRRAFYFSLYHSRSSEIIELRRHIKRDVIMSVIDFLISCKCRGTNLNKIFRNNNNKKKLTSVCKRNPIEIN